MNVLQRPRRRELLAPELEQPLRCGQILESVLTEIPQCHAGKRAGLV